MADVLVLHAPEDADLVTDLIAPGLAVAGHRVRVDKAAKNTSMVLVLISEHCRSAGLEGVIADFVASEAVQVVSVALDRTSPEELYPSLGSVLQFDLRDRRTDALRELVATLPVETQVARQEFDHRYWDPDLFSQHLWRAVERGGYEVAQRLVDTEVGHISSTEDGYPAESAVKDMKMLQGARYFHLESTLGEALSDAGVDHPTVMRRYGQALIETRRYQEAESVLRRLYESLESSHAEWGEAAGLLGRIEKQRFMDALARSSQPDLGRLEAAIDVYRDAYERSPDQYFWQGINAVTLMHLGERFGAGYQKEPEAIASDIQDTLDRRFANGRQDSWDLATYAEVLIAKRKLHEARRWLEDYVAHPETDAFALGSTYRQFADVIEVGEQFDSDGEALLDVLLEALVSRRGGIALVPPEHGTSKGKEMIPMLLHVVHPGWSIPEQIQGHATMTSGSGSIRVVNADATGLQRLIHDPEVLAIEWSKPSMTPETGASIPWVKGDVVHSLEHGLGEAGDKALIAVIDSGIDILHEAFTDANGNSRIVAIWNQRDRTGPSPEGFEYGTEHNHEQIESFRQNPETISPNLQASAAALNGHGTHVASIAAGRALGERGFAGGMAPEAQLVVVVPDSEGESVGYSVGHHDALKYIDRNATRLGLPVVVNLSQGQNAGAHDGKSLLERTFDDFTASGSKPGRVVVKSAGNERSNDSHAKVTVTPGGKGTLEWRPAGDLQWHGELQLWFASRNRHRFRLRSPNGELSDWVSSEQNKIEGEFPASRSGYQIEYTLRHKDNGDSLLHVRVTPGQDLGIRSYSWSLEIEAIDVQDGVIHAWLERSDLAPRFTAHRDDEVTLTIPGTATTVITVGAIEAGEPYGIPSFTSYGPTRDNRQKPDIAAPGVGISAADVGTKVGSSIDQGTSMAAPHVTGAIALLMSHLEKQSGREQANSNIVCKALHDSAQFSSGRWTNNVGYGVLDAARLLEIFY